MSSFTTRRSRLGFFAALAIIGLATTSCAGSETTGNDSADTVELTFSTFVPEDNPHGLTATWFMEEVTERSDGRITFKPNFLEAGCPAAEHYQCATDGRADVVLGAPVYEPQKFPITLISAIQYLGESNDHKARAFAEFYAEEPAVANEYAEQGLTLLGLWSTRLMLGGKGDPYEGPADLEGQNIRTVGGPATTALSLAGANPIAMTANEVYEALQRGVVDGYAFSLEGIAQYSLDDHSDFIVDTQAGGYSALNMVMNRDRHDALSEANRAVIDEVSAELTRYAVGSLADVTNAACDALLENSNVHSFDVWTDAEARKWEKQAAATLRADWEKTASEHGVDDPSAVFESWEAALASITDPVQDAELDCAARFVARG